MQEDRLNQCRKQFLKSGRILSGRSPQSFSSKLEKIVKVNFFLRKQSFLEKFCCSSRMHFWHLLWSFCGNVVDFSAHSRKTVTKLKKFIEKTVLYKFIKKDYFQQNYFRKKSKMFCSRSENNWKFWGFWEKENYLCTNVPWTQKKTVLTTMSKNIYKIPNIFPQSPLVGVNFLDKNDIVMQKVPLNGCRKQFFKSGGTLSDRCPQIIWSKLGKFVKVNNFFRKHTFPEKFCCSSKMHFWHLLWSFCANVAEFSAHSRKTLTKLKKFMKKQFNQKSHSDR